MKYKIVQEYQSITSSDIKMEKKIKINLTRLIPPPTTATEWAGPEIQHSNFKHRIHNDWWIIREELGKQQEEKAWVKIEISR